MTNSLNANSLKVLVCWVGLSILAIVTSIYLAGTNFEKHRTLEKLSPLKTQSTESKIENYKSLLKENPQNIKLLIELGDVLFELRNYPEAISTFLRAEKIDQNNKHIENDLGLLYLNTNHYDKAILKFKRVLDLDAAHIESFYYIGLAYQYKNDKEMALQFFKQVQKADPYPELAQRVNQEINKIENQIAQ